MYFTKIEIENIKCFGEKVTLDLTNTDGTISPWTLILGDNGIGKTTLLEALVWMSPVVESDHDKLEKEIGKPIAVVKPFIDDLFDDNSDFEHITSISNNDSLTSKIIAYISTSSDLRGARINHSIESFGIEFRTSKRENRFNLSLRRLEDVVLHKAKLPVFTPPHIFAYNASRHMEIKNLENSELLEPYSNLFSVSGALFDAQERLLNLHHASLEEYKENEVGDASRLLEKVKQLLVDLLPNLSKIEDIIIRASERLVLINMPSGLVPLNSLSLGYKTMLALAVDLANRMFPFDPNKIDPFFKLPAIVVIDEVDLHLHPKWQREIRAYFTKHFPNTQFICTAHSPVMAQSAEGDNICVVSRFENKVTVENRPNIVKGWKIGQIITNLFDISERSLETNDLINERRKLLDQNVMTEEDRQKLKLLDDRISKLPIETENQQLLDRIERLTKKVFKVDDTD